VSFNSGTRVRFSNIQLCDFNFTSVACEKSGSSLTLQPGDLGTGKRPGTSCKIEIHFWFKITQYLTDGIHFPVEDTDTKFQTVSQKNQGVTSD
jgi:hypothetical protein